MLRAIVISSLLLNLGLLLGRFSGFVRESMLAGNFGLTAEADVAVLMLTVPDFLLNLMVGGGIAAALVPEFTSKPDLARAILFQALILFLAFFCCLTGLLIVNVEWVLGVLAPGFSEYQMILSVESMRLVLWLLPLGVVTAVYTAYLQANNRFGIAAMGTLIINTVIIVGLLYLSDQRNALVILASFVLFGGAVRLISQVFAAGYSIGGAQFSICPWYVSKDQIMRFLQVAGSGSILLSFPVLVRAFSSYEGEGSIAMISFATKLVELPLAITVTFLATVLFPRLSKAYQDGEEAFSTLVIWGVRVTLFMSLISLVSILPVSYALSSVVYGRGMMSESDVAGVSGLLQIGLFYIPFMGLSAFCTAALNAKKATKLPLIINLVALVVLLAQLLFFSGSSLADLLLALVVAYGFAGVVSLLVLLGSISGGWRACFKGSFILVVVLLPLLQFTLLDLLPVLPDQGNSFLDLVIAFLFALVCCVFGAMSISLVRQRIQKIYSQND